MKEIFCIYLVGRGVGARIFTGRGGGAASDENMVSEAYGSSLVSTSMYEFTLGWGRPAVGGFGPGRAGPILPSLGGRLGGTPSLFGGRPGGTPSFFGGRPGATPSPLGGRAGATPSPLGGRAGGPSPLGLLTTLRRWPLLGRRWSNLDDGMASGLNDIPVSAISPRDS
jgi:hypothetical protein